MPEPNPTTPSPIPFPADKKLQSLLASNAALESQLAALQSETVEITGKLQNSDAEGTVKRHIKLLHDYNEIRDVGLGLMGMIAENRGVRVKSVMEEFGVQEGD